MLGAEASFRAEVLVSSLEKLGVEGDTYTIQHGTKHHDARGPASAVENKEESTPSVCERSREQHCPLPGFYRSWFP